MDLLVFLLPPTIIHKTFTEHTTLTLQELCQVSFRGINRASSLLQRGLQSNGVETSPYLLDPYIFLINAQDKDIKQEI